MTDLALIAALIVSNAVWAYYLHARDNDERSERDKLLTRIQAPQIASLPKVEVGKQHVSIDSDEEYWATTEPNGQKTGD